MGRQSDNHGQARFVLGDYSGQLKDLTLQDMCCRTVDLESATCLTSIRLRGIDCCTFCELKLPSSVVQLKFFGHSLITKHAHTLLEGLSNLTQVVLGTCEISIVYEWWSDNGSGGLDALSHDIDYTMGERLGSMAMACLPIMPSSLRWLHVTSLPLKMLLDDSAHKCLGNCVGLEHLILPAYAYPSRQLHAWVKAAPYVRVSDNDPEQRSQFENNI